MSAQLQVRSAITADLPSIVSIAQASPSAPQWPHAAYGGMLAAPPAAHIQRAMLVAEADGALHGFAVVSALVGEPPIEAELESIAVAAEFRRRGVGQALLHGVLAWAERLNAQNLRLEVRAGNEPALRLYAANGFLQTGRRKQYYAHPDEDAICLQRSLPGEEATSSPGATR